MGTLVYPAVMSRTTTRAPLPPSTPEPDDPYEPSRITDPERRVMTAVHEAAHCVAALALGLPPFRMVEIDDNGNGRVLHPLRWPCSVASRAIFLLAGAAGEAVHSGRPVLAVCERECGSDWQAVQAALREDHTRQLRLDVLAATSQALVEQHWREVEVLAAALLAFGRLDYRQVLAVLPTR